MRESSVKTRDDLAETGLGQRVNIEGTQVRMVGLIRESQGEWETQERIMTLGISELVYRRRCHFVVGISDTATEELCLVCYWVCVY